MWLWDFELQALGFVRKSERYWRCERRYGLPENAHLSIFSWSEHPVGRSVRSRRYLVEVTEFHVTLLYDLSRLHFYFHERHDNEWVPGGHTSAREIRRLALDRDELRVCADSIACEFVTGMLGRFVSRRVSRVRRAEKDP